MSETNELFATVNYIKSKVDTLEKIELLRMREDQEQKLKYLEFFESDEGLKLVYKEINGVKGQREIAQIISFNEMRVSRIIKKLEEKGLIEFLKMEGNSKVYIHTVVEKAYHFCKNL